MISVGSPAAAARTWPGARTTREQARATTGAVTGYERGTITPFGSARPWPVIADERVRGRAITLGAGEHGLALAADADAIVRALNASVADISDPEPDS
jgi:Cys-tRNA(Pro)/Cys-tRNA(Cys) deacylase